MDFPGVKALDHVSFSVDKGQIVGFLGENGAGKSTLLKILNGDYKPTSGKILLNGKDIHFASPNEAIDSGISVIYQERQLVPYLSVAENIFMGNKVPMQGFLINFNELNKKAQSIINEFNLPIKAQTKVKDLSVAYQQMVEIMKAYARNGDVLCFDEPTAPLTDSEIKVLFDIILKLKSQKKAIIYVSHRMNEMFSLTDNVVILKDGKFMSQQDTKSSKENDLIKLMVGRDLGDVFKSITRNTNFGDVVLKLENVSNDYIKNISFEVRKGEIVGLSGLAGAGRTETARAIFGADPITKGKMYLDGKKYSPKSPKDAIKQNVALCPEDRKLEGLALIRSVKENISLATLPKLTNFGFIKFKEEKDLSTKSIKDFNIKTPSMNQTIINLSGGNQQKTILARWMCLNPKLIIFDEPTKGIDIGAKSEIYHMICEIAKKGVAIIMISSELTEIIGLCDKILILREGKIEKQLKREDATEQEIVKYAMFGSKNSGEAVI